MHEKNIVAEDDQVFFMQLQTHLAKQPPAAAGEPVDASPRVPRGSPQTPNRSVAFSIASMSPIPDGSKKKLIQTWKLELQVKGSWWISSIVYWVTRLFLRGALVLVVAALDLGLEVEAVVFHHLQKSRSEPVLSDVHMKLDRITWKPVSFSYNPNISYGRKSFLNIPNKAIDQNSTGSSWSSGGISQLVGRRLSTEDSGA